MRNWAVRRDQRSAARRLTPSFARAIAKSNIMRNAGNVNSQVMSDMACSITTVEGLDAILEVVDVPAAPHRSF